MSRILLLVMTSSFLLYTGVNCGGQGLVSPQSACKIRCENGGMCVFDLDRPDKHSCICLLGVFTGERCQTKIATPELTTLPDETTKQASYETAREEARRRDDEERKREYEKQVAAERERSRQQQAARELEAAERAKEEERRRGSEQEKYWKEENSRREQERLEAQKRHDEARRAHEERLRQYEEEKTRRENQRREEEQRRVEEQQKIEEERVKEEERRRQEMAKEMADKQAEAINEQWEYREGENGNDDEDYVQVAEKDEYDEGMMEKAPHQPVESVEPAGSMDSKEENIHPEDEKVLKSISSVFNKAVEETIKEHPIVEEEHMEQNAENVEQPKMVEEEHKKMTEDDNHANTDEDDYWDHTPKKTDEDYARDNDEKRISTGKSEDGDEYGMEEGQEGWMMVKKEEQNSTPTLRPLLSILLVALVTWLLLL